MYIKKLDNFGNDLPQLLLYGGYVKCVWTKCSALRLLRWRDT